ncbi:feruloyl-CoA synthase [soil metagenome]
MALDDAISPFRDARYAPLSLSVERRDDGSLILANTAAFDTPFPTMAQPLDHWAASAPDRTWLAERQGPSVPGWRTLSYADGAERVARLAAGLRELGLGPGAPLLILARNGIDHAVAAYAALRIGCPIAPVSPQYGQPGADPARLAYAVSLIAPYAAFTEDAEEFGEALIGCEGLFGRPLIAARNAQGRMLDMAALEAGRRVPISARRDDVAKLLLTSGSTGKPKSGVQTHANLADNSAQIAACFNDPEPPVLVNSAPWSHSLGANSILHATLHRGGTLYIDHGQPTPARFGETLRNLSEVATTYCNMVPAGWQLLIDPLETDAELAAMFFSRLRLMQYGGAGLPQSVAYRVQAVAVRTTGERISFGAGYGSTETGPTLCNVPYLNSRAGLCGLPVPGTTLKLSPAPGGKMECMGRGPQISPGYRTADGAVTPLPLEDEGFYGLGDAVRLLDEARPELGLVFDGRLVENFKLATGAFVAAGPLRLAALSALGGLASEAVVCGENEAGVGLMLFLNVGAAEGLDDAARRLRVRQGLASMNASAAGVGGRIARALILDGAPDAASGELSDKGSLNQALARSRRPTELGRLYAERPDGGVIVL